MAIPSYGVPPPAPSTAPRILSPSGWEAVGPGEADGTPFLCGLVAVQGGWLPLGCDLWLRRRAGLAGRKLPSGHQPAGSCVGWKRTRVVSLPDEMSSSCCRKDAGPPTVQNP